MANRIKLRIRPFLISIAVLCIFIYSYASVHQIRMDSQRMEELRKSTVKFVNRCSCALLYKLYPPIQDFTNFPCLDTITQSAGLKQNGKCVRTVNFPKKELADQEGCVLLKYGRGTPICTHSIDEDIHVSRALITRGMWEEDLVNPMLNILDSTPSMVLLDIGCNIGVYTLSAALYSHKVICIDANFENLFLVSKSLTLGKLRENVTLIWNAIAEEHNTVVLRKELQNVGGAAVDVKNKTVSGCDIAVNSVKLDDLKELFGSEEVYMKLDVEGFEHRVLNSGKSFLKATNVRYVQMEFDTHRGHLTGTVIIDIMSGYGFVPYTDCSGNTVLRPAYHSDWPYDVCFIRKTFRSKIG